MIGTDHGMRAHGDGWVVTVALIEGVDLALLESTGLSDPYVVFTCNGQTRSSSVKLETSDPQWNGLAFLLVSYLKLISCSDMNVLYIIPCWFLY